jgi:hypothetical protein
VFFASGIIAILVGPLCAILIFKNILAVDILRNTYFLSFALSALVGTVWYEKSISFISHVSRVLFSVLITWIISLNLKRGENLLYTILKWLILNRIEIL